MLQSPHAPPLHRSLRHTHTGFTLIEVLIALLLIGAGLLALGGLQSMLSRHTDLSRQRGEATLLARAAMDTLRHQGRLPPASADLGSDEPLRNPLAGGSEDIDSDLFNTRYTRRWTVGGQASDALRPVGVELSWPDRQGDTQHLRLHSALDAQPTSALAPVDPSLAAPAWHTPLQRHPAIPLAARDDGPDRSRLDIDGRWRIVFDNRTGQVLELCGTGDTHADLSRCEAMNALLLSGHLTRSAPGLPWPTGMDLSALSGPTAQATCLLLLRPASAWERDASLQYLCLLPLRLGQAGWQGKPRWRGLPTGGTLVVCRYEYAPSGDADEAQRNAQGPEGYGLVSRSLTQQNYLLHQASEDALCPPDNPSTFRWALHQDCRAGQAQAARDCP